MDVTFKAEGFKGVEDALKELGDPKIIRRIGLGSLRKGAEPMRDKASELAPKDEHNLADAVDIAAAKKRRGSDGDEAKVLIGINKNVQPPEDVARQQGSGTYRDPGVMGVAVMQEFGTPDMPANSFMRPAMDSEKDAVPDIVAADMWPRIKRAVTRLARKTARLKK